MPTLNRSSASIHYVVEGKGEPILFVQGAGVIGEGWRPQVEAFKGDYETCIYDNRGIGASSPLSGPLHVADMVGDALAIMDALGWKSAHVVGHSLGGVVAQQIALDAPNRVRSLALLCTVARGADATALTARMLWLGIRSRVGTRAMRRHAFLEMVVPASLLEAREVAAVAEELGALFGRDLADSPPVVMAQLRALGAHDTTPRLVELGAVPTLVMSATDDVITRFEHGERLAARIPGARFVAMKDAAHAVTIHEAERVNEHLRAHFLRATERPIAKTA